MPNSQDVVLTSALEKTLEGFGMYDTQERTRERENALERLQEITHTFVLNVCERRKVPKELSKNAGGAIFTYGSYKLGVNSADADIDTLCVVPNVVFRSDFFQEMLSLLRKTPEITHITAVPDSFVPVIKFKFNDIPIDFVCARLNVPSVSPGISLKDSSILQGLDDRCIRSINGTRVADDIIRLVPNVNTFRTALRCIKLWAMKKAVYSNVMGFLGGVAWAILVARICQLYPNACASVIISKFFRILPQWNWPSPVILKPIEDGLLSNSSVRPWNGKANAIDRTHRMPVITPSYPSMCATHNVTASTQRIILGEFNIAAQTVDRIMANQLPWSALFQPHTFFDNYKYYLQVVVSGDTHDRYLSWSGLVEAKLRQLVIKLEAVPVIALVHPFVKGFKYEHKCHSPQDIYDATHGQIILQNKGSKKKPISVFTKVFYIGLYIRMRADYPRTLDLTRPIYDFIHMLKCWNEYNRNHMGIVVENVKRSDLPEEVFPRKEAALSKRALSKSPSPVLQPTAVKTSSPNINKKPKTNTPISTTSIPVPTNSNEQATPIAMTSTV
ncbi:hypothetical protein [Parasitella parasitica]|uniref:Poly(A) polymerase n=1 Tax=Parasitella parasitica TaxID=35722 RepID=A0A0B7NEH8_9FUNG|nr:hypothetical protein [Parasitella parasitica]